MLDVGKSEMGYRIQIQKIKNKINIEMVRQKLVSTILKEIEKQTFIEIYFPSSLV